MTEESSHQRHKSLNVSHPEMCLSQCILSSWVPAWSFGLAPSCLHRVLVALTTPFQLPQPETSGSRFSFTASIESITVFGYIGLFQKISPELPLKMPFISKAIVFFWQWKSGHMTPVTFPLVFKAFHHFPPCLLPRIQVFHGTTFIQALFHHVILWLLLTNAKFQKLLILPWTGYAYSHPCGFQSLHLNYPRPLLFLHCHVPIVTLSSYFYLFNGCLTWHLYPTKVLFDLKIAPAPPGASLGPFPLQRLPRVLSSCPLFAKWLIWPCFLLLCGWRAPWG